jgi:hypothetical protein
MHGTALDHNGQRTSQYKPSEKEPRAKCFGSESNASSNAKAARAKGHNVDPVRECDADRKPTD